jgi:hypothetical protein
MKRKYSCLLLSVLLVVCQLTHVRAQTQRETWRQIQVLRSTVVDVEKLLGRVDIRSHIAEYELPDASLVIRYAEGEPCRPDWHNAWAVPEWTVVEATYSPDSQVAAKSLGVDFTRLRVTRESDDVPDLITYIDDKQGIKYTVEPDGMINNLTYFASKRFDHLRCDNIHQSK